ncbi:shikimate 5-dehydrogenase, partial [Klebsiella pneumoniae]
PCRPVARLCITLPSDRRVQKNLTTTIALQAVEQFALYTGVRPDSALVAEASAFARS